MRFQLWHIRRAECYVAISNDGVEENLMGWKMFTTIYLVKKKRKERKAAKQCVQRAHIFVKNFV